MVGQKSFKRAQEMPLMKVQWRTEYIKMPVSWNDHQGEAAGVEKNQSELIRQALCAAASKAKDVGLHKPFRQQKILSSRC